MTDRDPIVAAVLDRVRPDVDARPDWDDVARRVASTSPAPRSNRRFRRFLQLAPTLAGGLAIVALLAFLLIQASGGDAPQPATPAGVTGVQAIVQVVSTRADQTDEQAAERLEQVFAERARVQGIDGFRISRAGVELTVFLPRIHRVEEARSWLDVVPGLRVYDEERGTVISGTNVPAVAAAAEAPESYAGPASYYFVTRTSIDGPEPSEAAAAAGRQVAGRVVRVPADTEIVAAPTPGGRPEYRVLRDPLVRPGEVEAVTVSGARLTLRLARPAAQRLAVEGRTLRAPVIIQSGWPTRTGQPLDVLRYAGVDTGEGTLTFVGQDGSVEEIASAFAGGGVDALTQVVSASAVGPPPVRRGEPVPDAELPPLEPGFPPVPGSARIVLRGSWRGEPWTVFSYLTQDGSEIVSFSGSGGICPVGPANPVLLWCGTSAAPGGGASAIGRVRDDVAELVVTYRDGSTSPGDVGNGFFVVFFPPELGQPTSLVARDAAGRQIRRVTPEDPDAGRLFPEVTSRTP